ncbi:pentapeptide repeat-containing protein [Streptomyces sp. YIM 130001]|uniref:pentapeptide repeat-containing protein n=1 Tax=Streptomyces sp. YIM 130001 TaxID=2259644 RepID=UPI001F08901F|nr:pentapeptide repeat-containing protein [Streptomyces sp. YIM 130001]
MELRADCSRCFGLCCVALPFAASSDFARDKRAGTPCHNLATDFRCGIHRRLRDEGYSGCTVYDCFGAGQQVSQVTFGGVDWRSAPESAGEMFEVFPVMRQLHELLRYVADGLGRPEAEPVHAGLRAARTRLEGLVGSDASTVLGTDVPALRGEINTLLVQVGDLVRAEVPGRTKNRRGADLFGARLAGADLRGASLRGACLIAADLQRADLRRTDLIGADLRDADLSGADLTGSVFLTQPQLNAARGDAATRLPPGLARPDHWKDGEASVAPAADGGGRSGAGPKRVRPRRGRPRRP